MPKTRRRVLLAGAFTAGGLTVLAIQHAVYFGLLRLHKRGWVTEPDGLMTTTRR
jgi:hypothetical protein